MAPPRCGAMTMPFTTILTRLGTWTARPEALLVVVFFTIVWLIVERETLDFHGAATLAAWIMTFLIQRSVHRDTQAMQAKLDELLRADENASDATAHADDHEPETIEAMRDAKNGGVRPA
jgi:low affinity Fe/Cu permease